MSLRLGVTSLSLRKGDNWLIAGLDFDVGAGEALCLTGENGVGKTTLLRTLAGFQPPHQGQVSITRDGQALEASEAQASLFHSLGHQDALSPTRTAAQELLFQAAWFGASTDALNAAIGRLNLKVLLDIETRHLSAGQRRRLGLARLIFAPRPIWCLDEPMSPLDEHHRAAFSELMQGHLADGGLIVCAVHDPLPFPTRTLRLERPHLSLQEAGFV